MDSLRIPLTDIPDHGLEIVESVPVKAIQPPDADEIPVDSVSLEGILSQAGGDYLFHGQVAGAFTHPCDRCLGPARAEFDLDVYWTFQEEDAAAPLEDTGEEEETEFDAEGSGSLEGVCTFAGDEIDLAPPLWEELALAVPSKYVCKPDCRGLCPRCGVNLNDTQCACARSEAEQDVKDNAFAKLRDLFPDLPK
ncbi:MAG: DUF177 domain-containing protein [Candidatus Hydrogenedentes bacterium]|nr:DUF177 domain-containing protein [Candidatus Hydrogenedentota bacterium]